MSNKDKILEIQERDGCTYEKAEQKAIDEQAALGDTLYDQKRDGNLTAGEKKG